MHDVLGEIYVEMCDFFREREDVVKAMILGLLSKQHVLLLGPPGTAKSAMARALASHIGAKYFEYLLTRFTAPEEIFGFLDVKKAVEEGVFVRNTAGVLPEAEIAFLDEIFKANSAILNSLLTIINERVFHQGAITIKVPLITLYAASNELPEEEELAALYDRLLVRCVVEYLRRDDEFKKMLLGDEVYKPRTRITIEDLKRMQEAVAKVDVTPVVDTVVEIRREMQSAGIIMSDRRYKQALSVVKAHAFFNGRSVAKREDLNVLTYVLWDTPEQIPEVQKIVLDVVDPFAKKVFEYKEILKDYKERLDRGELGPENAQEVISKLKILENEIKQVIKEMDVAGRDPNDLVEILNEINDFKVTLLDKLF